MYNEFQLEGHLEAKELKLILKCMQNKLQIIRIYICCSFFFLTRNLNLCFNTTQNIHQIYNVLLTQNNNEIMTVAKQGSESNHFQLTTPRSRGTQQRSVFGFV